ncbi:SPOSA6832_02461 [Sporobolomyces salmonicolor]|uniref:SPOSA6832_02461-mRNA-1:cds n=1 Tax=Sporidiobolus salmonicolor TaxID=5005 RepID=A0A0D6EMI4_SPOSA|nr:SPOSA6832_02461 [Sporobolomyces salmonicolor]
MSRAFIIVGMILWCVMESIGELATLLPVAGSFPHYLTRTVDPAVGFTLALSYGYCELHRLPRLVQALLADIPFRPGYTIAIASEVSAAAVVVSYWTDISPALVISLGLAAIFAVNMMSVRAYGEIEVVTASLKVLCFLGLIIVALVITLGGAPDHDRRGFRYWHHPGAFTQYDDISGTTGRFLAFLAAFVNAAFSFIGVETVVVAAGEAANPHKSIPKAVKRVTFRISFFYILGALLIGMIVPYNDPNLASGTGNANSSPWVIAIKNAGIPALDSIVNACILTSAWSAGNSYCYVGARIINAMAIDRQAPQFFSKVNRLGVPYYAVIASFAFGPLAYLSLGSGGAAQVPSPVFSPGCRSASPTSGSTKHARSRASVATPFPSRGGSSLTPLVRFPWGFCSLFLLTVSPRVVRQADPARPTVITLIQGFSVFLKGNWSASDFVASYVGIPIFIVPAILWKVIKRSRTVRASEMDLWSGRFDSSKAEPEPEPTTRWGKFVDWLF